MIEYGSTVTRTGSGFAGDGWLASIQQNWPIVAGVLAALLVIGFFLTKR
jgi:LPXTG-motif cell wall-anchored protein